MLFHSSLLLVIVTVTSTAKKHHEHRPMRLNVQGMTILKAVYGSSCNPDHLDHEHHNLHNYVKALCDQKNSCSGKIASRYLRHTGVRTYCKGDFHVVAVCANGEIRSDSIDADATGKVFTLNCKQRELAAYKQHSDWMYSMRGNLANKTIKELRLAGSHNAGSSMFKGLLYQLARSQDMRVGQLLIAGVRFLDYKIGQLFFTYGPRVVNGPFHGQHALEDLLQIWAFTQLHPKEFIIIDLQNTHTLKTKFQRLLQEWINVLFHDTAIKRDTINIGEHTMGKVWETGRRILILHERPISNLIWVRSLLQTRWPNFCNGTDLTLFADNECAKLPTHKRKLVILQWVITVRQECLVSLYERSLSIKKYLVIWMHKNNYPFTIITTDFTSTGRVKIVQLIIDANKNTR